MDTLHTVLRSIKRETKGDTKSETSNRRDHLDVFREFLDHLAPASARARRHSARRSRRRVGADGSKALTNRCRPRASGDPYAVGSR